MRVCCGIQHEREVVLTVTLFVGIISQQQYLRACHRRRQEGERGGRKGGDGTERCACVHACCGGRRAG